MTDRELLEAAAKAAGLKIIRSRLDDPVHGDFLMAGAGERNPGQKAYPWNPLDDDGDALRLAAKLYLWDAIRMAHRLVGGPGCPDIYAATRRAIVRAAAALSSPGAAQTREGTVYIVATGEVHEGRETYTRHEGVPPPLCDFERLYTSQPVDGVQGGEG